jgi:hypothetical protein
MEGMKMEAEVIVRGISPWCSLTRIEKLHKVREYNRIRKAEKVAVKKTAQKKSAKKRPVKNPYANSKARALFDLLPPEMKGVIK